ncbi:GNAT family N-acetyltransferase [Thermoflexus sp.]|uniref:GNAT family N-acetyltransferase n=1 Tax=Thermoflexus sp. TaxID=1969742 RepID=UPI0017616B50|nr:GNAT family N-acetyltransferase [Thermoflexus sp.]
MEQANRSRVRIRRAVPEDALGIARVRVITWKAQYAGIVPAEYLAQLSPEEDAPRWRRTLAHPAPGQFILVAEDQAQIVGFAAAGPERTGDEVYRGEVYAIYVLPEHQRQGIDRRLMSICARELLRDGIDTLLVWVLEANPARRFYEQLGGELVRTGWMEIGGARLRQLGYGWRDLHILIRR